MGTKCRRASNTGGQLDMTHEQVMFFCLGAVQYLVLGYSHQHAGLTANIGNLALLKLAAEAELIDKAHAAAAHDAYRRLRQFQHALRLQGDKYARVEVATLAREAAAVRKLWDEVLGQPRAKP